MRIFQIAMSMLFLAQFAPAAQAATDIRVIISGDVAPGVYGRVEYGNDRPPPILYATPTVFVRQPQTVQVQPIYLHVPPGHAKNWGKHCGRYNACARPVYFVQETWVQERYEEKHGKGHGKNKNKGKGNKHDD